jgi:hypothetical protein
VDDFYLEAGLGTTSPRVALELREWAERNNLLADLHLRGAGGEVPRLFADILGTERVSVKGLATLVHARVSYKSVKKVLEAPNETSKACTRTPSRSKPKFGSACRSEGTAAGGGI